MQFTKTFFALATLLAVASAAVTLQRRIADPDNPANLVNCEPGGGADDCHLEQPVSHSSSSPFLAILFDLVSTSATAFVSTTVIRRMVISSGSIMISPTSPLEPI